MKSWQEARVPYLRLRILVRLEQMETSDHSKTLALGAAYAAQDNGGQEFNYERLCEEAICYCPVVDRNFQYSCGSSEAEKAKIVIA